MNNDRLTPLSVRDGHMEYSADGKVLLFMLLYGGDFAANQKRARELIAAAQTVTSNAGVGVKVPMQYGSEPTFLLRPVNFSCNSFEYLMNASYLASCTHSELIRTRDKALRAQLAADKSARLGLWNDIPPELLAGQPGSRRDPDGGPARIGSEKESAPLCGARKIAADANASKCKHLQAEITRLNASSGAW